MVEKDRALVLLEEIAHITNATSVDISNKSFSEDAALAIGAKLSAFSESLTHVNFSDIIAGRMEVEALVALKNLCDPLKDANLIDLDLSDNALGETNSLLFHPSL